MAGPRHLRHPLCRADCGHTGRSSRPAVVAVFPLSRDRGKRRAVAGAGRMAAPVLRLTPRQLCRDHHRWRARPPVAAGRHRCALTAGHGPGRDRTPATWPAAYAAAAAALVLVTARLGPKSRRLTLGVYRGRHRGARGAGRGPACASRCDTERAWRDGRLARTRRPVPHPFLGRFRPAAVRSPARRSPHGTDVFVLVDETNGPVDTGIPHPRPWVRVTEAGPARHGLSRAPASGNLLWFNGDYPLYRFARSCTRITTTTCSSNTTSLITPADRRPRRPPGGPMRVDYRWPDQRRDGPAPGIWRNTMAQAYDAGRCAQPADLPVRVLRPPHCAICGRPGWPSPAIVARRPPGRLAVLRGFHPDRTGCRPASPAGSSASTAR